jgi:hypothetical protein
MSPARAGPELDPEIAVPVRHHVAQLESRGRLYLPPWLVGDIDWLKPDQEVLLVFDEPGMIRLLNWGTHKERVVARQRELAAAGNLEAVAALQDRYRLLSIPGDSRPILGEAAMVHLGLTELRHPYIYVVRVIEAIRLMSPRYRNRELSRLRSTFESLP